jgi:hypothetical protein
MFHESQTRNIQILERERQVRIALIHAMQESIAPIRVALAQEFPQAEPFDLLDTTLASDRSNGGREVDEELDRRFMALTAYALDARACAILFTCSAFGSQIDRVRAKHPSTIIRKPNEAMIAAVSHYKRIGLIASFAPTLASMMNEFPEPERLRPILAMEALDALRAGDGEAHDYHVKKTAAAFADQVDCFALAQFSTARAAPSLEVAYGKPVLATPNLAARELRLALGAARPGKEID